MVLPSMPRVFTEELVPGPVSILKLHSVRMEFPDEHELCCTVQIAVMLSGYMNRYRASSLRVYPGRAEKGRFPMRTRIMFFLLIGKRKRKKRPVRAD